MLYVFYNEVDSNQCAPLVLKDLDNPKVRIVPAGMELFSFKNKIARILLWIGFALRVPLLFNFSKSFLQTVKGMNKDDKALIFGSGICISSRIAFPFCKICKAQKKYRWIWDTILNEEDESWLLDLKKYFEVWTFDRCDAKRYGLKYKNTVCACPKNCSTAEGSDFDCDVYFVGADRGRYDLLNSLYEDFTKEGLLCKFLVIKDDKSPKTEKKLKLLPRPISLEENFNNVLRARAVLDISTEGQNGLTQRTLEGLFRVRKIISSNPYVMEEKIFNEKNIFVLGQRPLSDLPTFIRSELAPFDPGPYTINEWIEEFL
ncbi:MAG: hypothetical protein K5917_03030 [Clostridiales bacterium]|nr:hypothetical protein [Clostridiales bacterium]